MLTKNSYISDMLYVKLDIIDYAILGVANSVFSIFSDLFESFMKRCAGIKVRFRLSECIGLKLILPRPWRIL